MQHKAKTFFALARGLLIAKYKWKGLQPLLSTSWFLNKHYVSMSKPNNAYSF